MNVAEALCTVYVQSLILNESPALLFMGKGQNGHRMSNFAHFAHVYPVGLQPRRDTNVRRVQLTAPMDHMCQFSLPLEGIEISFWERCFFFCSMCSGGWGLVVELLVVDVFLETVYS